MGGLPGGLRLDWVLYPRPILCETLLLGHFTGTVLQKVPFGWIEQYLFRALEQLFLLYLNQNFKMGPVGAILPIICRGIFPIRSPARAVLGYSNNSGRRRSYLFSIIGA